MTEPSKLDIETIALDELMDLAKVTEDDVADALAWWNETASDVWKGVLDEQD